MKLINCNDMYGNDKDKIEKPYYSKENDINSPKKNRKPYEDKYAQPTNEDEVFQQQFFWDIKDGLGGF